MRLQFRLITSPSPTLNVQVRPLPFPGCPTINSNQSYNQNTLGIDLTSAPIILLPGEENYLVYVTKLPQMLPMPETISSFPFHVAVHCLNGDVGGPEIYDDARLLIRVGLGI